MEPTRVDRKSYGMPLDSEKILCAVRVLDSGGLPLGTGFFVSVQSEALNVRYGYLVTAHHVVENDPEVYVQATDPYAFREGRQSLYPPAPIKEWRQPWENVDLVVAPAPWRTDQAWATVRLEVDLLPTDAIPRGFYPQLGGTFYYLGLFAPLDRLIARSGTFAALDQTGIPLGRQRPDGQYPDSYPTHCGLPVLRRLQRFSVLCRHVTAGARRDPPPIEAEETEPELPPLGRMSHLSLCCGLFTDHYDQQHPDRAVSRLGVGFVLRSDEIKAALMTPRRSASGRSGTPRTFGNVKKRKLTRMINPLRRPASRGEFERFEDLTRKLAQVPKSEVDQKRKERG